MPRSEPAPGLPHRRALRLYQQGAFVLAVLALVAAAALLPRGDELLLIHVKNRQITQARELLADPANHQVSSAASVVAHHELYLLEGRVDDALGEMEAYARANPNDVAAWRRLVRMFADAQRLDDRLRAAERVYALQPSAGEARQLVTLYRWRGDEAAEARVLRDLVTRDQATVDESLRSARLEAAFGHTATALDAVERMRRRQPGAFDYPALELYASLLLEAGGPPRLAGPLQLLPLAQQQPEVLTQLAHTLTSWGRPDAAVALFATPAGVTAPPERLALRARTAIGTSQARPVASELVAHDASTPLAPTAVEALVTLLLSLSDYDSLTDVLTRHRSDMQAEAVSTAIGHAVADQRRDRAQALIARLGDDSLLDSPMLALDLAVERGDATAADRWIARVDARAETTADQRAALAQFETRLGLTDRAFARLTTLVASGAAPDWSCADLAALAVRLGRQDEALALLMASSARGSKDAWARLAVTSGRTAAVDAWLRSAHPHVLSPQGLRDLYFLLAAHGHADLAARAANRLLDVRATADDRVLAGQAWLAAGSPLDALVPLRAAATATPPHREALATYDAALVAALQSGADVADELRRVFRTRLADPTVTDEHRTTLVEGLWTVGERAALFDDIARVATQDIDRWLSPLVESALASGSQARAIEVVAGLIPRDRHPGASQTRPAGATVPPRRIDLVNALMTLQAPDAVLLPHLRDMAAAVGDTWVHAYDERLAASRRNAERIELWTAVGRSPTVPRDERRAAVSRLVELGATRPATEILGALASDAGPADADVLQLIYLWGTTPAASQITWLVDRATRAPAHERAEWIQHVLRAGRADGARRLVAAMPTLPADAAPEHVEAWIDAYGLASDAHSMRRALLEAVARPQASTRELRYAGRAALAREWPDVATTAFATVIAREPADREALRWLGALAFYDGRAERARTWLETYEAAGGGEAEPLYQLGELARGNAEDDRSRHYFERALAELDRSDVAAAQRPLLANVLVRVDARQRAVQAFESLLDADPTAGHVRADYVAALLQWGDDQQAGAVLAATPSWRGLEQDDQSSSGTRRLALLKVQWLTRRGRYAAARQLLLHLGVRFPTDPDVLLARAAFDGERGRQASADRYYESALFAAPQRDDINSLVRQRVRQQLPQATFEAGARSISRGWEERTERLALTGRLRTHAPLGLSVERLRVTAAQLRRSDGAVGPVDADLTRVELSLTLPVSDDIDVGGALFGTNDGVGAGLTLSHDDLRGRTELLAESGRPFWEFLEGVADDGRRDRVSVQRQVRLRPDTGAWAQVAWNRYRLGSGASAQSSGLTLGVIRTVRNAAPAITLQYGLDKEHRLAASVAHTADGTTFNPVPFASREVHLLGAVGRFAVGRLWDVETTGGYTIDRLGGRGSFLTARAAPRPGARAGVAFWADRRLFMLATTQQVLRVGAQLTMRLAP